MSENGEERAIDRFTGILVADMALHAAAAVGVFVSGGGAGDVRGGRAASDYRSLSTNPTRMVSRGGGFGNLARAASPGSLENVAR